MYGIRHILFGGRIFLDSPVWPLTCDLHAFVLVLTYTMTEGYKKGLNAKGLCRGLTQPLSKAQLPVKYSILK